MTAVANLFWAAIAAMQC